MGGGGGALAGKHPRDESYWDMWKTTFCPQFTMVSFTFLAWVLLTAAYMFCLCMMISPSKDLNDRVFLGPDRSTLHTWGALDAWEIQNNYQIWRLFTSLFLSYGFSTYCISSGALLVLGFIVENPKMSPARMAIFYFGCGILGNLFSVCVQSEVSVGPMPAIMALTSGLMTSVIVNWKVLAGAGMIRICLIFMTVFLFIILLILSIDQNGRDEWESISLAGEGGGFMAGIGMGLMLMPHALERPSPWVRMMRKIGLGLTVIYAAILIPVFFCSVDPV